MLQRISAAVPAAAWAGDSGLISALISTAKADDSRSNVVCCLSKQLGDGEKALERIQEEKNPTDPE